MTWGEWLRQEDCNEECPYYRTDICKMQGMVCYGGSPIEPPCTSADFPEDQDIDEIVHELIVGMRQYEEREEKLIAAQKAKEEKKKKAAETRHRMQIYCVAERAKIKVLKKQIASLEKIRSFAESMASAVNATNEMFRYEERVRPKSQFQIEIDRLKAALEIAEQAYKDKRKEFYALQKQSKREE